MHPPENEKELYDELADRLNAQDGTGARRIFHELQKTGRSRQEIVAQISRLIEKRREDKHLGRSTGEIPWLRHREPSTWSHAPVNRPQHRFDIPMAESSGEPDIPRIGDDTGQRAGAPDERNPAPQPIAASGVPEQPLTNQKGVTHTENAIHSRERRQGALFEDIGPRQIGDDVSVPERAASKLNLQTALLAQGVKPSASTEAVAAKAQPTAVQRASRASAPRIGIVLTGISVIGSASAGLFVLWKLYGSEVQEFVSARPPVALAWLQKISGINNGSFSPDADTRRQSTGPQKADALDESIQRPKQAEASAAQLPTDRSIRNPEAAEIESPSRTSKRRETERNTGDTSAPPTAQIAEKLSSQTAPPTSQIAEPVTDPNLPPSRSQQNEPDAAQAHQKVARQVPPIDTGALVAQGDQLLAKSDVASARLLYQRAAEAGDGRGSLRMGMTFDPLYLARWRLRGVRANRAQAIAWYRQASAFGNADAELMRRSLVTYAGRRRRYY